MKLSLSQADLASVDVDRLILPIAGPEFVSHPTFIFESQWPL